MPNIKEFNAGDNILIKLKAGRLCHAYRKAVKKFPEVESILSDMFKFDAK